MELTGLYRRLAHLVPEGLVSHVRSELLVAGVRTDPREFTGGWVLAYLLYGVLALTAYAIFVHGVSVPWRLVEAIPALDFFLVGLVVAAIILEMSMYYAVRSRAAAMEKVLPDFLQLIASNLRAGMTPFAAFVRSARPEFGALSVEVNHAAANLSGSASLNEALDELSKRFDSMTLKRVVVFFKKGVRSGGRLAALLVASAEEIRRVQDLREELQISTRTYTIFLGFIVMVIMPFLLSISTQFVSMFVKIGGETAKTAQALPGVVPMFSGNISITSDEMSMVAYISLLLTSCLVSALTGIISTGKPLDGIKYAPIFVAVSLLMYLASRLVVGGMMAKFT
jgi:flagellar protein FlaJ